MERMSTITLDVRGVGRVDVKLNGSANPGTLERNGGSLMIAAALRERSALDHQINGNQDASTKQLVAAARDYIRLAKRLEKEGLSEQASIQRGNASEIYSQLGNSAVATVQKKLAMKNMADHGLTLGAKA
ncbi:MAG: hypothetical protein KGH69_05315, partial [Candidatus Micrarchaeota archaeon]|nr:hypothetical protein [Candidatus Micrarchaeota archaeon]